MSTTEATDTEAADTGGTPTRPIGRPSRSVELAWGLLPLLLVAVGCFVTRNVDAHGAGALGLIEVMPIAYFAAVALLGVSFVLGLRHDASGRVLGIHIVALILLLHGIVSWIEGSPRFAAAHTHLGFIEYIQREDASLPSLDARMSWPAFFAVGALMNEVAGLDYAMPFLLWAPLFNNFLFAPLVFALARALSDDRRVPWITTYLFFALAWVGQDYFAPQSLNFVIFLGFVTILVKYFRVTGAIPVYLRPLANACGRVTGKVLRVSEISRSVAGSSVVRSPHSGSTALQRVGFVAVLGLMYAAMVISHQLSPIFLLLDVIALVLLGCITLRGLPLLMVVAVTTWISYGAIAYWSGHIEGIFGGFGNFGNSVNENVNSRVDAVQTNHVWVIYIRIALSAVVWLAAVAGIVRRLRTGRFDHITIVCFLCPFLVLGAQSYGGEGLLRVFVFALPFAAILVAFAWLPRPDSVIGTGSTIVACAVIVALVPIFMIARFGNEQFEYISRAEIAGVDELFRLADTETVMVAIDPNAPILVREREQHIFLPALDSYQLDDPSSIFAEMNRYSDKNSLLFISHSQVQSIAQKTGRAPDWDDALNNRLLESGQFGLLYENPDVRIYELRRAPA